MATSKEIPSADHVFDGGSLDCGSGLILLIRQNMLQVPDGGILEIRSSEPTVKAELEADKTKAKNFHWNLRARKHDHQTTVYSRNFSWKSGNTIDFDRSGKTISTLEQFFGALLADVIHCFSAGCSRNQILLDELEGTLIGTLNSSLAAAGVEEGDSSVKTIKLVVYVTSPASSADVQREWAQALTNSPVFQTLLKSCEIDSRIVLL
jgi:hypothetical protein